MIEGLKPYSAYRATGDRWLTHFPSTWERVRIKYLLREIDRRTQTGEEPLLSMRRDHGLVPLSQFSDKVAEPKALLAYKLVEPGELVVNRMQAGNGLVFVARIPGLISPDYAIFRPVRKVNLDYLELLFRSYPMRAKFRSESTGLGTGTAGFLRLYGDSLGAIEIGLPSPDEQSQIVRFLDHAARRIRRYIRAKKMLIALLNEQKQAIIQRAVCQGLDPNVRLKPSGIDSLGDVPHHWSVSRLRNLVNRIDQGVSPQSDAGLAESHGWGVLKSGCVNRGIFRDTEHKRLPASFAIDHSLVVRIGDVLVSRASGSPQLVGAIGRVGTLAYQLILSDKTFRLIMRDERLADFVVAAGNSRYIRTQIEQAISGAEGLANNLPLSSLKNLRIAIPPPDEATRIAEHLGLATARPVRAIVRAEQEVELLLHFRARLVADVVTGKLDVYEAAAHLPDAAAPCEDAGDLAETAPESDDAELDDAEAEITA
jgi:type I restriction enzyme S subunit